MSALENMYHRMSFEELALEAWHSENRLAKELLEKFDVVIELERVEVEVEAENEDVLSQLYDCMLDMQDTLQSLVNDLIEAKGTKRKSQEAILRFKESCENMPSDYLETFSPLWDIYYEN